MSMIKYRAWDIDKQLMIDWETILKKRNFHDLMDNPKVMLMQFTGAYDSSNNEIYDKDIVLAQLIAQDDIVFDNQIGLVNYCEFEWNLEMGHPNWPVASWFCVQQSKIIGNVFESDNLIKTIVPNINFLK